MDAAAEFRKERAERIRSFSTNEQLKGEAQGFLRASLEARYSYNFSWMGRPVIQYPQDLLALQEIIWSVQPDLIVETGIAHGGSLIFSASMLALLGGDRRVVGVDVDIRSHNRAALEEHPMFDRITMLEGSSLDPAIVDRIGNLASRHQTVMLTLDSNHCHSHVLAELRAYADLVSVGSYAVVFDGVIEAMPAEFSKDRPWGPGNSPLTAIREFLSERDDFEVDRTIEDKLLITAAPSGYLKRTR
jgi:cephalosporin hydroxylase